MDRRTDLALESFDADKSTPGGVVCTQEIKNSIKITRIRVENKAAAQKIGKPVGNYITLELADFKSAAGDLKLQAETAAEELRRLLPGSGTVLVAGLGNSDITPDAVGPLALSMIFATRHISGEIADKIGLGGLRPVAAVTPGVLGKTGMETGEIIKNICGGISPCAVIAVDALAALSVDRLGNTIQISDAGIIPGSGVQNARKGVNEQSVGVPVIALGVPTVADMSSLLRELSGSDNLPASAKNMIVTPKEIDIIVERAAKTAAYAINRALLPELDFETLEALIA